MSYGVLSMVWSCCAGDAPACGPGRRRRRVWQQGRAPGVPRVQGRAAAAPRLLQGKRDRVLPQTPQLWPAPEAESKPADLLRHVARLL